MIEKLKNSIIASAMNPLSTVEFAHACKNAGFWPSITLFAYKNLQEMQKAINSCPENTIISASQEIFKLNLHKIIDLRNLKRFIFYNFIWIYIHHFNHIFSSKH